MNHSSSGTDSVRRLLHLLPPDVQRGISHAKRKMLGQPLPDQTLPLSAADQATITCQARQAEQQALQSQHQAACRTRYEATCASPFPSQKVSVIVPNYNYARFLDQRLDSILAQTYPIHELILLDDASSDNSVALLQERAAKITQFPVKVVPNDTNSGCVFAQWEKGVALATGDFFWIAEADDFCAPEFLETAMKPFVDDKVLLSYTDSSIVDESGTVTRAHSREMFNIFGTDWWESPYINAGKAEITDWLSVNNTILNASSLVWRKADYSDIFAEARSFRLAGDWYFYLQVLLRGDIAYHPAPLNYYRMHSNVVRKTTSADIEYQEISRIQQAANTALSLPPNTLLAQRRRRAYLEPEVSASALKKRVAILCSPPFPGSGGHRTIIQNINALVAAGYDCDLYYDYCLDLSGCNEANARAYTESCCGECGAEILIGKQLRTSYDLVLATVWDSAKDASLTECPHKAYFIQDYEPWFYPMGDERLAAEQTYRYGLTPITIGRWLAHTMETKYGTPALHFDFCADLSVYHPLPDTSRRHAVCAVYQPGKPRRCSRLLLAALRRLKELDPDAEILLYGSNEQDGAEQTIPGAENLHVLPVEELNRLYNSCAVGLSISSSNPSRIPFEMLAAGLPVVELEVENNQFDFPKDGITLAQPDAEQLAQAIYSLLSQPEKARRAGDAGALYMKDYPLQKGFQQFVQAVEALLSPES